VLVFDIHQCWQRIGPLFHRISLWRASWQEESQIEIDESAGKNATRFRKN